MEKSRLLPCTKRECFSKVVGTYYITCKSFVGERITDEQAIKKIIVDKVTDRTVVKFDPSLKYNYGIVRKIYSDTSGSFFYHIA
jgi:hypothetical protein